MRVSVVLLCFYLCCVQLQRADDQLLHNSHVERSEPDQTNVQPDVRTELRDVVVEQREQLEFTQSQIEQLKKQNTALEGRVVSTEVGVEALREENANTPKLAFSFASGLNGNLGPLPNDTILVFKKEITNFGKAYSKITGVFIAPLRGVYYFRFNVLGSSSSHMLAVCLYKNEEKVLDVTEYPKGTYKYAIGGATLLLQKGDHVYVMLRSNSQINDNSDNHCNFSGFLLFAK
ncbi:complement C1q-like protein 2 [Colossoma macropomum]|uniref:complement C1q-like protein 2 n=1 Tax=Colossoma macropomum TaxID=42526 RepID=UPI001864940D|nr:complement C1q-like protein 2 [Colossoma macropomum]